MANTVGSDSVQLSQVVRVERGSSCQVCSQPFREGVGTMACNVSFENASYMGTARFLWAVRTALARHSA